MTGPDNSQRLKKDKGRLVFAKNKKQAIIAFVIGLFFLNSVFVLTKYILNQRSHSQVNVPATTGMDPMASGEVQEPEQNAVPGADSSLGQNITSEQNQNLAQDADNIYSQTVNLQGGLPKQPARMLIGQALGGEDVDIISKNPKQINEKKVSIVVAEAGRANPFLPASESIMASSLGALNYLPPPPETLQAQSDASKIMTTVISGILYDQYSPSAIINIEGTDYLVKRGDVINHYKILSISKTQVVVQLGKNAYKAGVGELLSKTDLNANTIANLNKKFGGNYVSINVKKKG